MAGVKKYEELRDRAEAQRDESEAELAMTMSELEDLLGAGHEGVEAVMALQSLSPHNVIKVIKTIIIANPDFLEEVVMGALRFVGDMEEAMKQARTKKKILKPVKDVHKYLATALGEIVHGDFQRALDAYDRLMNDDDDC